MLFPFVLPVGHGVKRFFGIALGVAALIWVCIRNKEQQETA